MLMITSPFKNRHLKRFIEHSVYLVIVLLLIPGLFYFEICVVLPTVVEEFSIEYFVHLFLATFILINIIGNLIYGAFTDTSIRGKMFKGYNSHSWSVCTVCECVRPPRAWHCDTCNICILKRDHHCTFFASCVGYYNHRYFLMFTCYIFVAMLYSVYFNIIFVSKFLTWNHGLVIAKFMFPLVSFVFDFGAETIYVFIILINFIVAAFTGFLLIFHLKNVFNGKTVSERKYNKKELYDRGWKLNIIEVFGYRWYLTWLLPFIQSPLPGDGIQWNIEDKFE